MGLLGLAQGATYTPAIMLVSTNAPPDRKASAVGWILAGMSAGYALSIVLANAMLATADSDWFCRNSRLAVVGSALSIAATRNARDQVGQTGLGKASSDHAWKRQARLLTLGYVGHTWELFGTCSTFACGLQSSGGGNRSLLPCPSLTALMMIGTSIRNGSKGN